MDVIEKNPDKSKKSSNPHAGHRKRLKDKYKKGGLEILSFHEIFELLMFYSIPRKDTNKIAHELEEKFGKSISNIIDASDARLKEVDGFGDESVTLIRLLVDVFRMYNIEKINKSGDICSKESHEELLIRYFTGKQFEEVVMITLNNRMERICKKPEVIYVGSVNSVKVDVQKMVKIALDSNASGVIIAHNHPNGSDYPSSDDIETTKRLNRLFNEISIYFVEHYVVSETKISGIKAQTVYGYKST